MSQTTQRSSSPPPPAAWPRGPPTFSFLPPIRSEISLLAPEVATSREYWTPSPQASSGTPLHQSLVLRPLFFNPSRSVLWLLPFSLQICSTFLLSPGTHLRTHARMHNSLIVSASHSCCKLSCRAIICLHDSFQLVQWFLIIVVSAIPLRIWLQQ